MQGLMNRGGAYMQNAAQRGMETANRRGLLNSSIAAGSAERSSLEAAMPIAQADAATYGRTQSENMGALNQGLMQERDIMNQQTMEGLRAASSGQNAQLQAMLAREGMQLELQRQRENLAFSGEQQGLDRFQQQQMAQFGFGADLARNQQQYGFQRGLNEQGFGFDAARMGLQDYYDSQAGQRDMRNQMILMESGMGIQALGNFYNRFGDEFWDNPGTMNDPYVVQGIVNFAQTFRPDFSGIFNRYYGG
jgi:hypothetical protein